jgi:hypothetical protein
VAAPKVYDVDRLVEALATLPVDEHEPPVLGYAELRQAAREVGYALAVHGSLRRDFDLVAVPWEERAVGNAALLGWLQKRGAELLGRRVLWVGGSMDKPYGRCAFTLVIDGWAKPIDLSVIDGGTGWREELGPTPSPQAERRPEDIR